MTPFLFCWSGNPARLKALQTESERLVAELFVMRSHFPSLKVSTQDTFERAIDTWLTVNGYDNRLGVPEWEEA